MAHVEIIDTNADNIHEFGMCGYKNTKHEGLKRKLDWIKQNYSKGMKYKILYSQEHGAVGGIEYIPGQYSWRPVNAAGYYFIHCIYIMSRKYKDKGYGQQMLEACLEDAKNDNMKGAAVVARKGTWMADTDLFIKSGFQVADKAPPDFELLVKKFDTNTPSPTFKGEWDKKLTRYGKGLTIVTSDQCPYTTKAVNEICETAETLFGITPVVKELTDSRDAQDTPCAFGTFFMVYDGKVVAEHPVSKGRFKNIMNKILK